MKIQCVMRVFVVTKNVRNSDDGKTEYYNLAIMNDDGDAGNLSCTEGVYQHVQPMRVNTFVAEYNSTYKSFRLLKVDEETPVCDMDGVIDDNSKTAPTAPHTAPGGNQGKQDKK